MNRAKHITILSGGGSPHSNAYRDVYEFIEREAAKRGVSTQLVDYVGFGHFPEFGLGLNLPRGVEKARRSISERSIPNGSTLLCRSFGCDVGAYLVAHHREEVAVFSRIILWGPSGLNTYWDLVARKPDSLIQLNESVKEKGLALSRDFWQTFTPIEETVKAIRQITVEISYGTKDKYCDAAFAQYLAAILRKHTTCSVQVFEIEGAEHEIRPEPKTGVPTDEHERVKNQYFELIFGPNSKSRNQKAPVNIHQA